MSAKNASSIHALLSLAILEGDEAQVQALVGSEGLDLNKARDHQGQWPLLVAVKCGNLSLTKMLIDHGACSQLSRHKPCELHVLADVQAGPFPQAPITPLLPPTFAARGTRWITSCVLKWTGVTSASELIQFWQLLMSVGAKPTWRDRRGRTPFHLACARGNWPVVEFLLQANHVTNVNHADKEGRTGLHYAAQCGRADVVSILLARGANPWAQSKHGDAAQVARSHGHIAVAEMIDHVCYNACPMLCLPNEVLHHILAELEPWDLCAVAQVCSTLNSVSSADCLWTRFCGRDLSRATKKHYMAWLRPRLQDYARSRCAALERSRVRPPPPNNVLKLNLTGDAGVGKTSVHTRFIRGVFRNNWHTCIGADFGQREIELAGLRVKLQVWDTAGQERFQRTFSQMYYRETNGVMIVYDITNSQSFEHVRQWADEVFRHTENVMLVGAKSDLECRRQVTAEEGMAMAKELKACGWAEVSNLTGAGVDEAFAQLAEAACRELNPFFGGRDTLPAAPSEEVLNRLFASAREKHRQQLHNMAEEEEAKDSSNSCVVQ